MATLGWATVHELDRIAADMTTSAGLTSPRRQLDFIVRRLGPIGAARRLGVSGRTLRDWATGTKPRPASAKKLSDLYQDVRKPELVAKNRSKLTLPANTNVQISGTVSISDGEEYRSNLGGDLKFPLQVWHKILAAWRRRHVLEVGELIQTAIQDAAHIPNVYLEADDYTLSITLPYNLAEPPVPVFER